jgi:hypothetical protein
MKLRLLINPFVKIAGLQSFSTGVAAMLLAGIVGYYSKTHFDGILNIHSGIQSALYVHLAGPFISVFTLATWFSLFSLIFGKSTVRTIDIFGTQCFAFIPLVPTSLLGFSKTSKMVVDQIQQTVINSSQSFGLEPFRLILFILIMLFVLFFTVWSAIWIYNGFKIASNLKDKIVIPVYATGLVFAMIIPKIILSLIQ